jgi:hypothetical protein
LNLPAGQLSQAEAPATAEYLPATQSPQSVSLVFASEPENLPGAQGVQTEAPSAEYLPATQFVQTVELVCAGEPKNLPAAQRTQARSDVK